MFKARGYGNLLSSRAGRARSDLGNFRLPRSLSLHGIVASAAGSRPPRNDRYLSLLHHADGVMKQSLQDGTASVAKRLAVTTLFWNLESGISNLDSILLDFSVKRRRGDTQQAGGLSLVAAGLLQGFADGAGLGVAYASPLLCVGVGSR